MLVERAELRVHDGEVWLVELRSTRSMRALRRDDGRFDLWYWVGLEASELLLASGEELTMEPAQAPVDPLHFDMGCPSTHHAVGICPAVTHLVSARLPLGFDRVLHRDVTRAEVPEPTPSSSQPRTTPG